jgi:hypothetical protein
MKLIPVEDKRGEKEFLRVAVELYRNDPKWIRPLDKDILEVFDPSKNKSFRHGECIRWILYDSQGGLVGRIAAFVNNHYKNKGTSYPVGGTGFFECVNDQRAADIMFNAGRDWLKERGMEAMDGPINFGERDRWWGLVVEGFHPPLYCMNYNPPYYRQLFESYGFRVYFNQLCYGMKVSDPVNAKFTERHDRLAKDPGYSARHIDKRQLDKFIDDFTIVYNKAWAGHGGNKTIEKRQASRIFHSMKKVMDEQLIWYIYYNGEPIGCWVNLPDLNEFFRHFNGKFGLFQKLRFLFMMKKGSKKFVGLVFGIIPEFQGTGADAYMIMEGANVILPGGRYEQYEMQWIGDFNPKMVNIAENLGTRLNRKLATYRYLFDPSREFQRHPFLV